MAKGLIKRVANTDARFGADSEYLFVKVQADWASDDEEFLLPTDPEYAGALDEGMNRVKERVAVNREDVDANKPGWLSDLFD